MVFSWCPQRVLPHAADPVLLGARKTTPFQCLSEAVFNPTWPPKPVPNWSQDDVGMQLPEKHIFAIPPIQHARCFLLQGDTKTSQTTFQDHFLYECLFNLKNNLQASILLQLGSLLGLPRRPQEASKASQKSLSEASWAILAASSNFGPPKAYPQAQFSRF